MPRLLADDGRRQNAFDRCVEGLVVDRLDANGAECTFLVGPHHCNTFKTLHGGAISTLVDIVGTLAILGSTRDHKALASATHSQVAGVSVDLNVSFLNAARNDDELSVSGAMAIGRRAQRTLTTPLCRAGRVLKRGKSLAFTEVTIQRKKDGVLVATGRHTKAFV